MWLPEAPWPRIACLAALLVAALVAWRAVEYRGMSFDGAVNAQAAFNLCAGNGPELSYEGTGSYNLQTGLPFQLPNAALLCTLGNHFAAGSLANVLFYGLLLLLAVALCGATGSSLPALAFIAASLLPGFEQFAFGGFGEVPALSLALWGACLLALGPSRRYAVVAGAVVIGLAVATKLALLLVLPALVVLALVHYTRHGSRWIRPAALSAASVLLLLIGYQCSVYEPDELLQLRRELLSEGGSGFASTSLAAHRERLVQFRDAYGAHSASGFTAVAKVLLGLGLAGALVLQLGAVLRRRRPLADDRFALAALVVAFSVTYLAWWFLGAQRPWYRRVLNGDVLLMLAVALSPWLLLRASRQRIARALAGSTLALFILHAVWLHVDGGFWVRHGVRAGGRIQAAAEFETALRSGLGALPQRWIGFGYGWWQAPRWSFLAGTDFLDLERSSALVPSIRDGTPAYLFVELENTLDPDSRTRIEHQYATSEVYSHQGFEILRLDGINLADAEYANEVDFGKGDFAASIRGFHEREAGGLAHARPDAAVFLRNPADLGFIGLEIAVGPHLEGRSLSIAVGSPDGQRSWAYEAPLEIGHHELDLALPEGLGPRLVLHLLLAEAGQPGNGDRRSLSVAVRRVATRPGSEGGVTLHGHELSRPLALASAPGPASAP